MEEYLEMLQNSERKMEFDHGSIFVMSGATSDHATISYNMCRALDDALGLNSPCVPYIPDKLVKVADEVRFFPDVVVSCDPKDHGKAFLLKSPCVVVEVLSRSTQKRDKDYKLPIYQANPHIQEIVFISQYFQEVEVISRTPEGWDTQKYHAGDEVRLPNLNITFPVVAVYRRLTIPAVNQIKEEPAVYYTEHEGYYLGQPA
jgi:Uma2 family endonuclease